jgi:hypothetical protein
MPGPAKFKTREMLNCLDFTSVCVVVVVGGGGWVEPHLAFTSAPARSQGASHFLFFVCLFVFTDFEAGQGLAHLTGK